MEKKGNLNMGRFGLGLREKVIRAGESEAVGKFYDYLVEVRDRQEILGENMKEVMRPKFME